MTDSILYFIQFTVFFLVYIIFIPAKVMGLKLSGKNAGENALKAMISSHVVLISCVYLLGILHIYNVVTLVISILAVVLVYWKVKGVSYKKLFLDFFDFMALISGGQYKVNIYVRRTLKKWSTDLINFSYNHVRNFFSKGIIEHLIVIASFWVLIVRKWVYVFDRYAYSTSDMYVHNEWINYMEQGDIFYDGVYPFGMHNMLSAFHKLSGLNLNIVIRYWGAFNCLLMVVMMYFLARRIFRLRMAAVLPVVIYCVTDFSSLLYGYRTIYTLPQECGMLFLFPCVYFLGRFIKNQKWKDGIYFVSSAAIVLAMHFYTVIFAVLLCAGLCVPFIKKVLKLPMLKKLIASVGLIALISITPFVVGLASGKYWQGSMTWAMGVMNTGSQTTDLSATDNADGENKEETEQEENKPSIIETCKEKIVAVYNLQIEDMNSYWGVVFWVCMVLFVGYYAIRLFRKETDWQDNMLAGVWVYLVIVVVMYSYEILGIPKIMKEERITMFLGYVAPIMLAFPAELLYQLLSGFKKNVKVIGTLVSYGVTALLFFVTYELGYMPVQSYYHLEPSLAAEACVKVDKEYPKNNWTIVSPVEGLALVRNRGYHYELWEFVTNMELYEEDMYLEIPTKYVFFIVEKYPIIYNQVRYSNLEYNLEPLDKEDADTIFKREILGISETGMMKYYNILENRRIAEAKLACWIDEYSKAFPDQMEVYMEDEECIVYKFEQNPYMLNNFAIDYGCNEDTELDYYKMLRIRMLERGEDTTEVQKEIDKLESEK